MPRPKGGKPKVRLSISLDPAKHAALERLATEHDATLAWIARKAITEFIDRYGGEQSDLPLLRVGEPRRGNRDE